MKRVLMLASLCVLLCHTSCKKEKEKEEVETKFPVTNPIKKDTAIVQNYVCQVHSIQHIELRAQERGYLEKIFVDEGQFVKKGEPLFQIMPKLYEAEYQSAKAEVKFADIEYQNTKQLADQNVVAPNELAMAEAKLAKANAELALAQVHLDFTLIRAPFDGIIDRFHVRLGSLVDEGELLTSLSDNSKMWVYYNVPEAEYLEIKTQINKKDPIKVNLLMPNNKVFNHSGVVETIEADFNNETGNISFRATFPNPEGLLRHGETGNILSTIKLDNALLIPQKATFEVLDKKYVYVVDKNNVIKSREIIIGEEMPHLYAVVGGLSENDKILIEGLRLVRENDKIHSEYVKPDYVISHLNLYAE
ncbi:efflux RND transporter periplasmic adaptor subunit [Wenyingzhuangia sp. chi5]|uniref:Efflux RND transporter periplasmic adaptor subunit n=1 Tax=Wenyingzhuangia gilva TaxID=3057677 RepID=A0ABT8VQ90_9FLAO|nr:efflux RND transporter periplasmic adaptor subunit [Wenyingzhuangia sp. chi5]MDO3694143.1 efflux RND transporter periplasmic adaptor subunit [Wenyingzhuangia sp. chi5]